MRGHFCDFQFQKLKYFETLKCHQSDVLQECDLEAYLPSEQVLPQIVPDVDRYCLRAKLCPTSIKRKKLKTKLDKLWVKLPNKRILRIEQIS